MQVVQKEVAEKASFALAPQEPRVASLTVSLEEIILVRGSVEVVIKRRIRLGLAFSRMLPRPWGELRTLSPLTTLKSLLGFLLMK